MRIDTFNQTFYLTTGVREKYDPSRPSNTTGYLYERTFFRSEDKGKSWIEDKKLKKLFDKHEFRKFEFLDKDHAIGFSLKKIEPNEGRQYHQGTYYLLQNKRIIDSFKTPDKEKIPYL